MSADIIQWIAVVVYFLLFWGFTAGEAFWLKQREWASFQKSLAFSISSNLLGFFVGTGLVFIIILILLMLTFEPVKNGKTQEFIMWVGVALVFVIPPVLLILVKRLLLKLFKMETGQPAWVFSMVSSVLVVFGSVLIPSVFLYIYLTFIDGPGK